MRFHIKIRVSRHKKCHIQSQKNVIKYNYINYPIIYEFYISEKSFSLNNILFMERNDEYMKKTSLKLLLFSFCMSFIMIIPTNVNAEEIIPVNISVKYGQTEAPKNLRYD